MFALFRHLVVVFFVFICALFMYDNYISIDIFKSSPSMETHEIGESFFGEPEYIKTVSADVMGEHFINIPFFPDFDEIEKKGYKAFIDAAPLKKVKYKVVSGDNIFKIMRKMGVKEDEYKEVIYRADKDEFLSLLKPKDVIEFGFKEWNNEKYLYFLSKKINKNKFFVVKKNSFDEKYIADKKEYDITTEIVRASGVINSSFYISAIDAGLTPRQVGQIVNIFKWRFDLNRSVRSGDSFIVEYEKNILFDEEIGRGDIKAVYFNIAGSEHYAIRFNDGGNYGYYDIYGKNLEKAFNRYPVDSPRITSSYSLSRMHPILNIRRPHRGTDFGGYRGKPIKAVGDGLVSFAGRNGGYGLSVKIKHGNGYETYYAHMSDLNVKRFQKVKRGQVIGKMGNTGRSTGTHLHYEMKINGKYTNPMKVKIPEKESVNNNSSFGKLAQKYKLNFKVILAEMEKRNAQS